MMLGVGDTVPACNWSHHFALQFKWCCCFCCFSLYSFCCCCARYFWVSYALSNKYMCACVSFSFFSFSLFVLLCCANCTVFLWYANGHSIYTHWTVPFCRIILCWENSMFFFLAIINVTRVWIEDTKRRFIILPSLDFSSQKARANRIQNSAFEFFFVHWFVIQKRNPKRETNNKKKTGSIAATRRRYRHHCCSIVFIIHIYLFCLNDDSWILVYVRYIQHFQRKSYGMCGTFNTQANNDTQKQWQNMLDTLNASPIARMCVWVRFTCDY